MTDRGAAFRSAIDRMVAPGGPPATVEREDPRYRGVVERA